MGQALQLVNIARDVAKDAVQGRVYVPLAWFPSASDLLSVLLRPPTTGTGMAPTYAPYTLPLLKLADSLRRHAEPATALLPRGARGGTRAMVASYFEIAEEIKRRRGEIDVDGVKVDRWRRGIAAVRAMWW
jgi:15-cis-phytoene synthase/lycopene beta-cyclase